MAGRPRVASDNGTKHAMKITIKMPKFKIYPTLPTYMFLVPSILASTALSVQLHISVYVMLHCCERVLHSRCMYVWSL